MSDSMRWIYSSGGPLILLPQDCLEYWSGIDPPRDGQVVQAKRRWNPEGPATDYDRACDVEEALATIEVGPGRGIVLGDEHETAFVPREEGGLLVRRRLGDSDEVIERHLATRTFDTTEGDPALIEVYPGPLILFDAACPGLEVEPATRLALDLQPGQYVACAIPFNPDEELSLLVIPLERVG